MPAHQSQRPKPGKEQTRQHHASRRNGEERQPTSGVEVGLDMRFQDGSDLLSPFGVKLLLLFMCFTGEQGYCSVLPPLAYQSESPGLHPGQFDRRGIHLGSSMCEVGLGARVMASLSAMYSCARTLIALFPLWISGSYPHVC